MTDRFEGDRYEYRQINERQIGQGQRKKITGREDRDREKYEQNDK